MNDKKDDPPTMGAEKLIDWLNHDSRTLAKAFSDQLKKTEAQRQTPWPIRRWP